MAITSGGRTRELVAEQARRISACRLTFFTERGPAEYRQNGAFVRDAISLSGLMDAAQPSLWQYSGPARRRVLGLAACPSRAGP